MSAITKKELDETVASHRAWVEQRAEAPAPNAALVTSLIKGIAPTIFALEQRIHKLEQRIDELERKGYVGVWKEGREYSPHSEVTHDGGRWLSHKRTTDKPGSSADWTLMEKSVNPRSDTATANARVNGHYSRPRPP